MKALVALLFLFASLLSAETGSAAWLRPVVSAFPKRIVKLGSAPELDTAAAEISRNIDRHSQRTHGTLILGTVDAVKRGMPKLKVPPNLQPDGYYVHPTRDSLLIVSPTGRGVLYGAFAALRTWAQGAQIQEEVSNPAVPLRWVDEWDNLDGSVERGYGGRSIFFENNEVLSDLSRVEDYARLLASIGINVCTVNNVNANPRVLTKEFLPQLARIAAALRPWGLRMSIAVDFASPKIIGGLDTFDPLDARVIAWWKSKADEIYAAVPDLAGFLLKADSEGRAGPSTYSRTHADAANLFASALRPHNGVLVYRAFVYNHHADWRNLKNDRARAAYDNFHPLDGQFADNVIVQIKHGPIDFQAREPVSPLLFAMPKTNKALELQITQEYTGQQRHLCFLAPMWKQVFDSLAETPLRAVVGVSNVGRDANWVGYDLAISNLYAFGRLAWNPQLKPETITEEWTRQTFGNDPKVVATVGALELDSWKVYEGYTGPLGLGTMTNIVGGHFGPGIESAENNGWGQWIRADHDGIGMDRTVATGTGYIGQYPPNIAHVYESLKDCPDELVLFMHHLPYSYQLHSGKTIVQHVYDSHYWATAEAQSFVEKWRSLRALIDDERYQAVLKRLEYQAGHAVVWRDAICSWFLKESGIADAQGRAGHFPNRIEAESMQLDGYQVQDVTPWEDASGGKAVACKTASCSASLNFAGAAGDYDIVIQYFDLNGGDAKFALFLGDREILKWAANDRFPTKKLDGDSSTRVTIRAALKPGDEVRIEGTPDGSDPAALDYLEITPLLSTVPQ